MLCNLSYAGARSRPRSSRCDLGNNRDLMSNVGGRQLTKLYVGFGLLNVKNFLYSGGLPQWCGGVVVTIWFEFLFLTQLFFSKHSFFNSWFYIENSRLTQTTLVLNPSPRPHLAISLSIRADNWSLESNWLSSDLVEGNISDTFRNKQKLNLAIKTLSRVSKGKNWGYEDKLLFEVS